MLYDYDYSTYFYSTYVCQEQRPHVPPGMSNSVREKHLGESTSQL